MQVPSLTEVVFKGNRMWKCDGCGELSKKPIECLNCLILAFNNLFDSRTKPALNKAGPRVNELGEESL